MSKTYGYCRISKKTQHIDRQIKNISAAYPDAKIIQERFTGTTIARPAWVQLNKKVVEGDTIVFDSVSRMSRNAEEGFEAYEDLFRRGVHLVFLKEPYINTETYKKALSGQVNLTGTNVDLILNGVNAYLLELAKEQIRLAFGQAEKEVLDLRQRTAEGIDTARKKGKQIGGVPGRKLHVKKADEAKKIIKEHAKDFGGSLKDSEVMKLAGIARNTYYKYKKELLQSF